MDEAKAYAQQGNVDVSLIVAFAQSEAFVGHQIQSAADHLNQLGRRFQIVAVNEGARDNSVAILNLLARRIPELSVVARDCRGRAFKRGVVEAQGHTLVLASCCHPDSLGPWTALGWALAHVGNQDHDAVVSRGCWVVAHRDTCLSHIVRVSGASQSFDKRFLQQADDLDLQVQVIAGRDRAPWDKWRVGLSGSLRRWASAGRG